jgi:hypothetical protein
MKLLLAGITCIPQDFARIEVQCRSSKLTSLATALDAVGCTLDIEAPLTALPIRDVSVLVSIGEHSGPADRVESLDMKQFRLQHC